ncbi:DUF1158 family protein [Salmonella enterica subsp. enterica serovar Weltevreden]|nr:DUF1158 family protein [Salmonella enterica subsp. enterica serovar Weltevreden]
MLMARFRACCCPPPSLPAFASWRKNRSGSFILWTVQLCYFVVLLWFLLLGALEYYVIRLPCGAGFAAD